MLKISLRASSALCSVAFLGLAGASPAWAQTAPTGDQPSVGEVTPQASADTLPPSSDKKKEDDSKEIIVTGSRIKRSAFNSSSPIAVIDPELAEKRGVMDTAELLQSSPIASGSAQVTSAISSNFVTDGGPGASTISLRGLGANRTLVLLNSRRAGPAGTRGAVSSFDLNVLPQSIISSVQIEKDGASSVYGSDAVAGVVNILTKTKTNGLELSASGNVSQYGGGDQYRISGAWGKEWGGPNAGHIMLAADYYHQVELAQGQRRYLDCPEDYVFSKSGTRQDLVNPVTGRNRCTQLSWGQVYLYDYSGASVRTGRGGYSYGNENLGAYVPNLSPAFATGDFGVPSNFYMMGYNPASASIDHLYNPLYGAATVIPDTKRLTFYGDASIKLGDHIELYAEGLWNRRKTYQNGFRQFWDYMYTEDWGGPPSGFTGSGVLSPTPITDWSDSSQKVTYWRAVGGARGDFGELFKSWTWDTFVQYSKSVGLYNSDQIYNDSVKQQTNYGLGGSCTSADLTSVRKVGCLPINWTDPAFLAGIFTPAQRNYLFGYETGKTVYKQLNVEFSATGNLFKLPAGNVAAAVGLAWRRDSIFDRPGDITYALKAGANPALASSYTNNSWGNTSSGITAGHQITKEAFAEIDIPIIYNTPFIQEFGISGSVRVTNSTATRDSNGLLYPDPANPGQNIPQKLTSFSDNGNITYKVGANWKVNDWLRFRGTWGTSYRAPALFENFLADQSSFVSQRAIDPCINYGAPGSTTPAIVQKNCAAAGIPGNYTGGAATATVLTGGGVGVVHAETSTAKTASIILTPRFGFLPSTRINLAVDYFNIEVKGEISQLGAANIVYGCYSSNFYPTDPLCSLFTRQTTAPVNAISVVHDSFINVNRQANEGVDVTANLSQDMGNWGKLDFTAEMTWQIKDTRALYSGTEQDLNTRIGDPRWTGAFNLQWSKGTFSVYYGLNVIGSASDLNEYIRDGGSECYAAGASVIFPAGYCEKLRVSPVFYHSISLTKKLPGVEITMGVTNLFNTKPPRVSVYNNGETTIQGQSVFSSQYDLIGRRGFVTVKTHF
ncbi:TonB-dependent receptor domain-containing protein [Sphingomonas pruni]|uniref:TonB-dependent receptor domain-containing protein n=1 Tax=Sphingomonas pruni TaxID=40683 RepID=UPI00082A8667|nr:TonB-dependent receptor [Sphingomonas pruni]